MLTIILIILLVLFLFGGLPTWNYYGRGTDYGPHSLIVLVLVIVLILALLGYTHL
jgi:hypothetical protein